MLRMPGIYNMYARRRLQEADEVTQASEDFDAQLAALKESVGMLMQSVQSVTAQFDALMEIAGNEEWPLIEDIEKLRNFFENDLSDAFKRGEF